MNAELKDLIERKKTIEESIEILKNKKEKYEKELNELSDDERESWVKVFQKLGYDPEAGISNAARNLELLYKELSDLDKEISIGGTTTPPIENTEHRTQK